MIRRQVPVPTLTWIGCLLLTAAPIMSSHATEVRMGVQAPIQTNGTPTDLRWVDVAEPEWVYVRDFTIPYSTVEEEIRSYIQANVNGSDQRVYECPTILCPDVTLDITWTVDLDFLQENQPKVKIVGASTNNTVAVSVDTQVLLNLNVFLHAESSLANGSATIPVKAVIGVHGDTQVQTWPALTATEPTVSLDAVSANPGNVSIDLGGLLGLFDGLAEDIVTYEAKGYLDDNFEKLVSKASDSINAQLSAKLDAWLLEPIPVADMLDDVPVPDTGETLGSLKDSIGMSVDVRTALSSAGVITAATTRFAANPGKGSIAGNIAIPQSECRYAHLNFGKPGRIPLGLYPINEDLGEQVGNSCSSIFGATDIGARAYLGRSPDDALDTGQTSDELAEWKAAGSVAWLGKLTDNDGVYSCSFQVTGLPDSGIVELAVSSSLAERLGSDDDVRVATFKTDDGQILLDHAWNPLATLFPVELGGPGSCRATDSPGVATPRFPWDDIRDCIMCDLTYGGNTVEIGNPPAFFKTRIGRAYKAALERGALRMQPVAPARSIVLEPIELQSTPR